MNRFNNYDLKGYDNWKLTDWREEFERDMPRTLNDYHIDQYIIKEVGVEQIPEFFAYLDTDYEEKYNFENLKIAEYSIFDQEPLDDGIVYIIQIIWYNKEEVIAEDEDELKSIINKEVDVMWEDDDTTEVKYEVDVAEEYWG